ncbi:MAG: response regulator [Gemmatimonadetes bacterium]|nr:response regulator [Gemmatimonadota bacterium]
MQPKLLIIDDDRGVRKSFRRILERDGFAVTTVGGAVAAFAELKLHRFEAIVCDVILPEADGTTFFEELREEYPEMASRVVFVTGWIEEEKIKGLLEYTGQPFLPKPVDFGELVRVVRQTVARADAVLEPIYLPVD